MSQESSPIDEYLAVEGVGLVERFNEEFDDTVLMVGQALGGVDGAVSCRLVGVDADGVDAVIGDGTSDHEVRLEFAVPVEVPDHLTTALLDLVERARAASEDAGSTTAEREAEELARIGTHLTRVVAVEDVHPHLRRITFGGGDLVDRFEPFVPDCFFYVLLPPPGSDELGIDAGFTWEAHARMPVEQQPVGAYYTLRHWRPEVAELDILAVVHDDHGGAGGHASRWAATAQVGDPVALWGPRTAFHPPEGTDRLVLVADETGLPAVAGILEWRPKGMPAVVIAEVASADEQQDLPVDEGVEVHWRYRDGVPAGRSTALVDAVRELPPFEGTPYVWGGGESKAMTAVRRHVRDERGLARDDASLIAYWRHSHTEDAEVDPS